MRFKKSTPFDSAMSLSKQMAKNLEKGSVEPAVSINPKKGVVVPVNSKSFVASFNPTSQTINLKLIK